MKVTNVAKLLEGYRMGGSLWSPAYGHMNFHGVYPTGIVTCSRIIARDNLCVRKDHMYDESGREVFLDQETSTAAPTLFPSKEAYLAGPDTAWDGFISPKFHKHFELGQSVIVLAYSPIERRLLWRPAIYWYYDEWCNMHVCYDGNKYRNSMILPRDGNEDKLIKG